MAEIILFDIPGKTPETKAWSPSTWKTRYALNIKGLKYRTEWVEYPDIEGVCQKLGAGPTTTKSDGSPYYTLPVIYDPSTDTVVAESAKIAEYLDATYPDTPRMFPAGTRGLHAAFQSAAASAFEPDDTLWCLIVLAACLNLPERSSEFFRRTREADEGKKLEDIAPEGEVREGMLRELEGILTKIARWYEANGDTPFIMGDAPTHSDLVIASRFMWARQTLGKGSKEWAMIVSCDDGRWGRFMQRFEKYEDVL